MKKIRHFVIIITLLLLLPSTLALQDANLLDRWTLNNTQTSGGVSYDLGLNLQNLTITSTTTGVVGKLGEAYDFDGSTSKLTSSYDAFSGLDDVTISLWFNTDTVAAGLHDMISQEGSGSDTALGMRLNANQAIFFGYESAGPTFQQATATTSLSTGTWYHLVGVIDSSSNTMQIWLNGVNEANDTFSSAVQTSTKTLTIGRDAHTLNRWFNGKLDEICIYDVALTESEIDSLYNAGSGAPCSAAAPAGSPYARVQVFDEYDNSTLSGYTVYIGTDSNVTDGSGIATVYNPTGYNYTVDGGALYFSASGTSIENATVQTSIYGAFPNISAYNVEGSLVSVFNITSPETSNSTVTGSARLLLPPDKDTLINISAPNYYLLETNLTTSGKDVGNYNFSNLYQTNVTINATNAYTGAKLTNFTGWVYSNVTGYNVSFSDDNGTVSLPFIFGNHLIYIDVYGYSISENNYDYANFNDESYNKTFSLYSENSISITIRNEETSNIITDNVTLVTTRNGTSNTYYTTTGTLFLDGLIDGNYTFLFTATNYSSRSYDVTVADRSTQTLIAFLSPGTDTVTFTIYDDDSGLPLESATVTQQRLINSTWTTISTRYSDITGRLQFTYTPGVKYRFTVSKSGYNNKVFELDPILFTSYNIRLERDLEIDQNIGLFDVTITYFPTTFIENNFNNFTITISSAGGTLESYGYNLTFPGGSYAGSGTNAIGQSFSIENFNITGASYDDRVILTYWYDSVYGDNKTYTRSFIIDGAADQGTIFDVRDIDYGLGTLEKILIAVCCTLLFAGVLTLFGNSILGAVGGLLALGFFISIQFISIWIAIPSLFVGFLIIMRRSSQ